jgi:hypothetical protein
MNARGSRTACYALVVSLTVAGLGAGVRAEQQAAINLRIAAQPLDDALREFSRQSGVQIVFFSHISQGFKSPGANGSYTLEGALEALLSGSGLSFRIINTRTVQVYRNE